MPRRDPPSREDGFTLIELMVVVLIIGILVAIALPTFLGARSRAQDSAAKATARTAFTAGRVFFSTDQSGYTGVTTGDLQLIESSVRWKDLNTSSTDPTEVSWWATPSGVFILATYSKSGSCFFIKDDPPNDTEFGSLTGVTPASCEAAYSGVPAVPYGSNW